MVNLIALCAQLKIWITTLYYNTDLQFQEQFGFKMKDLTIKKIMVYLYTPKDSSSLAGTRILFGLAMLFDIPDERGGSSIDKRWGDPMVCHFPLFPFITAVSLPYMALIYAALWLGALGITLGYRYHVSAWLFSTCYWYLLLIDKSYWNNHSYLFGLVGLLLAYTDANYYWSLDVYLGYTKMKQTVPYWNYFILKYQFFVLYFMAGIKKGTSEWLTGYSVQNLSQHWVFNPFKLFLTTVQTDYLIVHWFVFLFDLTVAFWMMWDRTRHLAMVFCALFHLMNSRLFRIGMFPWVCLATMPLFYPFDWPKLTTRYAEKQASKVKGGIRKYAHKFILNSKYVHYTSKALQKQEVFDEKTTELPDVNRTCGTTDKNNVTNEEVNTKNIRFDGENDIYGESNGGSGEKESIHRNFENEKNEGKNTLEQEFEGSGKKHITLALIAFHVLTQAFLPYSHFITKGYNNWTKGLYGYSWDMMVHTWDIESVIVKVVDNQNKEEFYLDPYVYTPNDRWTRHGDMIYQFAKCLKGNLIKQLQKNEFNMSIYIDVWCSMNGRFTQRMFDSKVDLLDASWSPFQAVSYLMPLLDEAISWRSVLYDMKAEVQSWNNYSDVLFVADFPGYDQEKYISPEVTNITLTVLDGSVAYEPEVSKYQSDQSYLLTKQEHIEIVSGTFHKVINIGKTPAFYMYTYANYSETSNLDVPQPKPKLPIVQELFRRVKNMISFVTLVSENIFKVCI